MSLAVKLEKVVFFLILAEVTVLLCFTQRTDTA